jgi:hypothetical protein
MPGQEGYSAICAGQRSAAAIDANTDQGIGSRIFVELNGGESATSINGKPFSGIDKANKIFLTPGESCRPGGSRAAGWRQRR